MTGADNRKFHICNSFILSLLLLVMGCKKDDSGNPNPDQKYSVPTTYDFKDKNGHNTVNFQGQLDRQKQLTELMAKIKTTHVAGTSITTDVLKAMFANKDGNGGGNFSFVSDKQIKNKTAGNDPVITAQIESYFDSLSTISASTRAGIEDGAPGKAGVLRTPDGSKTYLQSARGMEYAQIIEKSMMTATFYYQIAQVYLSPEKIGDLVDNATPVVEDGVDLYYTVMEHHWDEAFGYFSTRTDFPTLAKDSSVFLAKYSDNRNDVLGSNKKIMDAFLKGRAAISNNDLKTKNAMVSVIKAEIEKVIAGSAIHYLNDAMNNIAIHPLRNHVLSEAYAFINGLRFGRPPGDKINVSLDNILALIGSDFYTVKQDKLIEAKDALSNLVGLSNVKNEL